MQIVCSSANREAWLEARRSGIGASEIGAVLGVDRFRKAWNVWACKTGLAEDPDLSDKEHVDWGRRLEPVIGHAFAERTGRIVRPAGDLVRHSDESWALATLDAWCSEGGLEEWPLEIKTTSVYNEEDWVDGPPEAVLAQVHQQMLVTESSRATVAALIGGQRLVWCDVERDEQLCRKILYQGRDFWRRVVEKDPPPIDGSVATAEALKRLYPEDDGSAVSLPPELLGQVEELHAVREAKRAAEAREREIANALKATMGRAQVGWLPDGWSVSLKSSDVSEHTVKAHTKRTLRVHPPR